MASSSCPDAVDKPRLVANEPVARPGNNGLGDSVGRRPFVASRVVYAEHGSFGPVPTPIDVRHILAGLRVPPLQGRLDKSDDRDVRVDHLDLADPPSRDVADRHGIGSLQWLQRPLQATSQSASTTSFIYGARSRMRATCSATERRRRVIHASGRKRYAAAL